MKVWTFECEWDIGCNTDIYASKHLAMEHVYQALKECGIEESMEELLDEGLLSFDYQHVVENYYEH